MALEETYVSKESILKTQKFARHFIAIHPKDKFVNLMVVPDERSGDHQSHWNSFSGDH